MSLLELEGLEVAFPGPRGSVPAVRGLSLELEAGECLALVGESGSGKSTVLQALMRLIEPPAQVRTRRHLFAGQELARLPERELRRLRGAAMALVAQDSLGALHPLRTIHGQLDELLRARTRLDRRERRRAAPAALAEVGMDAPERRLTQYPHELSGGMRQRVALALALVLRPRLLLLDEPTTALDVTVQAQILELLERLRERDGLALLLVTHDWGVVARLAERVCVLYAGRPAEAGTAASLYESPAHPYTRGLLASLPPGFGEEPRERRLISGQPPDLTRLSSGCAFRPRCGQALERCAREEPQERSLLADPERRVACFATQAEAAP